MKHTCCHCGQALMSRRGLESHIKSKHDIFVRAEVYQSWKGGVVVRVTQRVPRQYSYHTYRVYLETLGQ